MTVMRTELESALNDPVVIEKGDRARTWLADWAERWRVEDAESLLVELEDKAHDLHEIACIYPAPDERDPAPHPRPAADALLAELLALTTTLRTYLSGGAA